MDFAIFGGTMAVLLAVTLLPLMILAWRDMNTTLPSPAVQFRYVEPQPRSVLKLRIKLHPGVNLPTYATPGSVGLDLASRIDTRIDSGARVSIPTGVAIALPPRHEGQIRGRSSLAMYRIDAFVGTIDEDYRGELRVVLTNNGSLPFEVKVGDRIAQLVVNPIARPDVVAVNDLDETARGAGSFGSSGR